MPAVVLIFLVGLGQKIHPSAQKNSINSSWAECELVANANSSGNLFLVNNLSDNLCSKHDIHCHISPL